MERLNTRSRAVGVTVAAILAVIMTLIPGIASAATITTLSATSGIPGDTLRITSDQSGWGNNKPITVTIGGASALSVTDHRHGGTSCITGTGNPNWFDCSFHVPVLSAGSNAILVSESGSAKSLTGGPFTFTINSPSITNFTVNTQTRNTIPAGSGTQTVTVNGANFSDFTSAPQIGLGGITGTRNGTVVNATTMTFQITAAELASSGSAYDVTITNPGGASSGTPGTASTITVVPGADLWGALEAPSTAGAGSKVTYTMHLYNNGPDTAEQVEVAWDMDDNLMGLEWCSRSKAHSCVYQPVPESWVGAGNTFKLPGNADVAKHDVAVGSPGIIKYQVRAIVPVSGITSLNTFAVAESTVTERPFAATGSANSVPGPTTVSPDADLSIASWKAPTTAKVGRHFTYAVKVKNGGIALAQDVRVTTTGLASGLQYEYKLGSGCGPTTGTWVSFEQGDEIPCGDLAKGATGTVSIRALATTAGSYGSSVGVTSPVNPDPNTSNNTSAVLVTQVS